MESETELFLRMNGYRRMRIIYFIIPCGFLLSVECSECTEWYRNDGGGGGGGGSTGTHTSEELLSVQQVVPVTRVVNTWYTLQRIKPYSVRGDCLCEILKKGIWTLRSWTIHKTHLVPSKIDR